MQHPYLFEAHLHEYQRQLAWINANDWMYERPARDARVRKALAKALVALAARLTTATRTRSTTANA